MYIKATIAPTLNFRPTNLKTTSICDTSALRKPLIDSSNIKCVPLLIVFTNFLFTYQKCNLSTSSWIMKKRLYNVLSPHLQNSPHGSFSTHPVNMPDSTCTQTFPFIFLSPITNGKNVEGHKKSLLALLTFFHLT